MQIDIVELTKDSVPLVRAWLTNPENAKWLDPFFQNPQLTDAHIAVFLMRHERVTYLLECDKVPVGIMGLTSIDRINQSAAIWSLLGRTDYRRKGIIKVGHILTLRKAFLELDLHSVHAWVVEGNYTARVCEQLGFSTIGRQRECHMMDGQFRDRILFDVLLPDFLAATAGTDS